MTHLSNVTARALFVLTAVAVGTGAAIAQAKVVPPKSGYVKLGVAVSHFPGGARIDSVLVGSPAEKAGLMPGDVIRSVDGYRIGFIEGLWFPLQSEVRRVKGAGIFRVRQASTGKEVDLKINLKWEEKKPPPRKTPTKGKEKKQKK